MTKEYGAQGFLPRSSDFVKSLRDEARHWGISVAPSLKNFEDSGLRKVFAAPSYQTNIARIRRDMTTLETRYAQRIDRSPLAYAFLTNPYDVIDAVEIWIEDDSYYGEKSRSFHQSYYLRSLSESQQYAAHLDTAMMLGASKDGDLGALTVPDADPVMLPLAAYVAHLRLDATQLVDLAPIYYRWNTQYIESKSKPVGIHSWVSRVFSQATSHSDYQTVFKRWHGGVPEGTELAWALVGARHRGNHTHDEWFTIVEQAVASGATANRFDEVASIPMPFDTALSVINNGIDNDLLSSMVVGA